MELFELIQEAYVESGLVSKNLEIVTALQMEEALVYLINLFIFKGDDNTNFQNISSYDVDDTNEVFLSLIRYLCSLYNVSLPSNIKRLESSFKDSYAK